MKQNIEIKSVSEPAFLNIKSIHFHTHFKKALQMLEKIKQYRKTKSVTG